MSEVRTADLLFSIHTGPGRPWILRPTNRVWRQAWWSFRARHLALQFAERMGITVEGIEAAQRAAEDWAQRNSGTPPAPVVPHGPTNGP